MKPAEFQGALDQDRIVAAIRAAESRSSGEIRVHVATRKVEDVEKAAAERFEALGMTATRERNGVLLYVAPRVRRFAILGDTAIHERCGPAFWSEVAAAMEAEFRKGRFTEGLIHGIERAGEALARHFPRDGTRPDVNELPDEVTED